MSSPLFSSLHLRKLVLPNRIVIAPMCQYSAVGSNVGDWHVMHLGHLSHIGAGLLIQVAAPQQYWRSTSASPFKSGD